MKIRTMILLMLVTALASCKLPEIAVDKNFKASADAYDVSGRTGFTKKKPMTFGSYNATNVRRGWRTQTNLGIPFIAKFTRAKHKISFDMQQGAMKSQTYALNRLELDELTLLGDFFEIPLKYDSYFTGVIKTDDADYPFVVPTPRKTPWNTIENGKFHIGDKTAEITRVQVLEGQAKTMFTEYDDVIGYEVWLDGKTVAAVQKINKDRIWISKNLTKEEKFAIANLCGALILMQDLEDDFMTE